jgi:hypothetical protein
MDFAAAGEKRGEGRGALPRPIYVLIFVCTFHGKEGNDCNGFQH